MTCLQVATQEAFESAPQIDRDAYQRVIKEFPQHKESLKQHSWVASIEGQPVAACLVSLRRYYSREPYPYIDLVAVNAPWQGQGLGRALLQHTLCALSDHGYRAVVHAHIRRGNSSSEQLFQSCGFLRWSSERYVPTKDDSHNPGNGRL